MYFGLEIVSKCVDVTKMEAGLSDASVKHTAVTPFSYSMLAKPELRPRIDSSLGSGCEGGCDCEVSGHLCCGSQQPALSFLDLNSTLCSRNS